MTEQEREKLVEAMLAAYEHILSACADTHKDLRVNKLLAMEHALAAIDASGIAWERNKVKRLETALAERRGENMADDRDPIPEWMLSPIIPLGLMGMFLLCVWLFG